MARPEEDTWPWVVSARLRPHLKNQARLRTLAGEFADEEGLTRNSEPWKKRRDTIRRHLQKMVPEDETTRPVAPGDEWAPRLERRLNLETGWLTQPRLSEPDRLDREADRREQQARELRRKAEQLRRLGGPGTENGTSDKPPQGD